MHFPKILLLLVIAVVVISSWFIYNHSSPKTPENLQPTTINILGKMKVKYPQDYTIVLVGDSMTQVLGNSDELKSYLKDYYPKKSFEVLNYGFGSTNILSVQDRLEKTTQNGRDFQPILDIDFYLILIESFGNNPLSQFPLEEGLKKQTEALDKIVDTIQKSNPRAKIAFVATIAPNKLKYAEGQVDLSPESRKQWAEERISYIKNHMDYAKGHNIPLINVFEKSLNSDNDGNLEYINKIDNIHPSPNGVFLISREIADFIYKNNIFNP